MDHLEVSIIFKIGAVGILVSVLSQILKHSGREEQAFLVSFSGLLLVLFWIVPYIYALTDSHERPVHCGTAQVFVITTAFHFTCGHEPALLLQCFYDVFSIHLIHCLGCKVTIIYRKSRMSFVKSYGEYKISP